jgi:hypothetical protein
VLRGKIFFPSQAQIPRIVKKTATEQEFAPEFVGIKYNSKTC